MKQWMLAAILVICGAGSAQAQVMKSADLEKYAKEKYGSKWLEAAANLASTLTLDKNEALTYQQVMEATGKTKEQLYVAMNYWVTATFKDKQAITLNDKEAGCIIVQSTIANIAEHVGTLNKYSVSITPIIRIDIKDGRVRVTTTVQNYDLLKDISGGWLSPVAALRRAVGDSQALPLRREGQPEAHLRQGARHDPCLRQCHHGQGGGSREERPRRQRG